MIFWIIIVSASLFSIFHLIKIENKLALIITIVQIIGVICTSIGLFKVANLIDFGWTIYIISILTAVLYSLLLESKVKRNLILILIVPIFFTNLFQILHFPGAGWLGLLCTISIFCYLLALKNYRLYKNEFGFLTIMVADALIIFLMRVLWLVNKF